MLAAETLGNGFALPKASTNMFPAYDCKPGQTIVKIDLFVCGKDSALLFFSLLLSYLN